MVQGQHHRSVGSRTCPPVRTVTVSSKLGTGMQGTNASIQAGCVNQLWKEGSQHCPTKGTPATHHLLLLQERSLHTWSQLHLLESLPFLFLKSHYKDARGPPVAPTQAQCCFCHSLKVVASVSILGLYWPWCQYSHLNCFRTKQASLKSGSWASTLPSGNAFLSVWQTHALGQLSMPLSIYSPSCEPL